MPPSASAVDAEQVSFVEVVTPALGVINTSETAGGTFSTVTDAVPVSEAPASSVAVAMHSMVSPGALLLFVSVTDADDPNVVPSVRFAQLYDTVGVSPSASSAAAEQVSSVVVVTPLLGLTDTEMTGALFSTVSVSAPGFSHATRESEIHNPIDIFDPFIPTPLSRSNSSRLLHFASAQGR